MSFEPQNILLINFGQIGDVILSLPAMSAVREKFSDAKITALIGKSAKSFVEMSGLFEEIICVDRNGLKNKRLWALKEICKLIADVRRRNFDFVIDIHSLYETNLLGFASGTKHRLFANRLNRSIDFLSNFRPKPPPLDRNLHLTDQYLQALRPLGIEKSKRIFQIHPSQDELQAVLKIFEKDKIFDKKMIGINLGAGHFSRYWQLEKFARLAEELAAVDNSQVLVFYGPEERKQAGKIKSIFPSEAMIYDNFDLKQLAVAFSQLKVLIGNDTGPMHLGAVVGVPVVLVMGKKDSTEYLPLSENLHIVRNEKLDKISVDDVFKTVKELL